MKIYLDSEYKCYTTNDGSRKEVEAPEFFNDKSAAFIEGYRYVPEGERWVQPNGTFFRGEMISPWVPYQLLAAVQVGYEDGRDTGGIEAILAAAEAAYEEGVNSI